MQEVKHHPASVDLELIKRLVTITKCGTLQQFLCKEFSNISKEYAGRNTRCPVTCSSGNRPVLSRVPQAFLRFAPHV